MTSLHRPPLLAAVCVVLLLSACDRGAPTSPESSAEPRQAHVAGPRLDVDGARIATDIQAFVIDRANDLLDSQQTP